MKSYERTPDKARFVQEAVKAVHRAYSRMDGYSEEQLEGLSRQAQARKHGAPISEVCRG